MATTGDLVTRQARPDDHDALQRVYRRASLSNPGDRAALIAHPEFLRLDEEMIGRGRTWVATLPDATVIGFASTRRTGNHILELDDLFVDPDWRRQGAASQLVERIVGQAVDERDIRIEVVGNTHAMSFYCAVGFIGTAVVATPLGAGVRMRLNVATLGRAPTDGSPVANWTPASLVACAEIERFPVAQSV